MIRPARPEDAGRIAEIWNRVIRDTAQTFTTAEKEAAALSAQMPAQPYLVAEAGGVVGFVTYVQFRGGPGYAHTVEHSVHVDAGAGEEVFLAVGDPGQMPPARGRGPDDQVAPQA